MKGYFIKINQQSLVFTIYFPVIPYQDREKLEYITEKAFGEKMSMTRKNMFL